jgi:hypothetical protein
LGGFAGFTGTSMLSHVNVNVDIVSTLSYIGGIAGGSFETSYLNIEVILSIVATESILADDQSRIGGVIGNAEGDRLVNVFTYGSMTFEPMVDGYALYDIGGMIGSGTNVTLVNVENYIDISIHMGSEFNALIFRSIGGIIGSTFFATLINTVNFEDVSINYQTEDFDFDYYVNTSDASIEYLGGIIGYIYGSVNLKQVVNVGDVKGVVEVGGIIGSTGGQTPDYVNQMLVIDEVANFGEVIGIGLVGGLIGVSDVKTNMIVANFMNHGDILGDEYVGGIIGFATPAYNIKIEIFNSYNVGEISAISYAAGGLIGASYPNDELFFIAPILGEIFIHNSYNIGLVSVDNVGKSSGDFFDAASGAIVGLRTILIVMDGVSFIEQESTITDYAFNDDTNTYESTGRTFELTLPGAGEGNNIDMLRVRDEDYLLVPNLFIYRTIWDFETVWTADAQSVPTLQFLENIEDRRV